MRDWNIIITVFQDGFRRAVRTLRDFGEVERSPYYNVLVMSVPDPVAVLEQIERRTEANPALYDAISRVAPALCCFDFDSADGFVHGAGEAVVGWAPRLAGCSFHVRLHRRGLTPALKSPEVERHLDDLLIAASQRAGAPARLSFTDPDAVIAVDTIDDRAGLGFWTRAELKAHRLLRPG